MPREQRFQFFRTRRRRPRACPSVALFPCRTLRLLSRCADPACLQRETTTRADAATEYPADERAEWQLSVARKDRAAPRSSPELRRVSDLSVAPIAFRRVNGVAAVDCQM